MTLFRIRRVEDTVTEISFRYNCVKNVLESHHTDIVETNRSFRFEIPVVSDVANVNRELQHSWSNWVGGVVCVSSQATFSKRRQHLLSELAKTGLLPLSVIIVSLSPSQAHSTRTHRLAAKIAAEMQLASGLEKILILEDDFEFENPLTVDSIINMKLTSQNLPTNWTNCNLAHFPVRMSTVPSRNHSLVGGSGARKEVIFKTMSFSVMAMIVHGVRWNQYLSRKVRNPNPLAVDNSIPTMGTIHINNPNSFAIYPMPATEKAFPTTQKTYMILDFFRHNLSFRQFSMKSFEWLAIHVWNLLITVAIILITCLLVL